MGHLDDCHSVRPTGNVYTLGEGEDEDMADDKEEHIDQLKSTKSEIIEEEECEKGKEGEEEARTMRGKKLVRQPSREEYDEHMRTHLPFRKWCPHCVKGKRKNDPRRADKEKEEQEVPTMSWDYMEQRGKDGKVEHIEDGKKQDLDSHRQSK